MVFFSVAMDSAADAVRGFVFDFSAPFLEVVFTIDEFRLALATNDW
jgi:hypothetical protein